MPANPTIPDAERRARLVRRHHLARTAPSPLAAARDLVALHSSDPATPHLSCRARVPGFTTDDLERALCDDRSLWRLHAMRRTLFVVAADEAAVFQAAAARDIARKERRRLDRWLEAEMEPPRIAPFLASLEASVLDALADGREHQTRELGAMIPELGTKITVGSGTWSTRSPISSRLLFILAMEGKVVRTRPGGSWRSSQYGWTAAESWFGSLPEPLDPADARATLARRYLAACGPATFEDVKWWTGWTVKRTRDALAAIDALTVRLEDGRDALVLPDDTEPEPAPEPVPVLLPGLDATPMAFTHRDWFLGPHGDALFDRNGNIGPSIWLQGRIVGGWAQRPDGEVVVRTLEDVGAEAEAGITEAAADLTRWLGDHVVIPRFRTPLEKALASGQPA